MRVAVVHNRRNPAGTGVINVFGPQNRETYNPRTVELVARALEHGGHTVRVIDGNMDVIEALKDFMPRVMAGERPGMVFNMAYGIQGVSRYTHLPAMLEMLGVPYVGSGPMAHGLALDKVIAKIMFTNNGLPTPGFWNFASPDDHFEDSGLPRHRQTEDGGRLLRYPRGRQLGRPAARPWRQSSTSSSSTCWWNSSSPGGEFTIGAPRQRRSRGAADH